MSVLAASLAGFGSQMVTLPVYGQCFETRTTTGIARCSQMSQVTPCAHCPYNVGATPWFDFKPAAQWVARIYNKDAWLASGWNTCELFKIVGVSIHSVNLHWMHDKHLGTDKATYVLERRDLCVCVWAEVV